MNPYILDTIREFNTKNFKVIVDAIEEDCPDLSFDESGETEKNIRSGEWVIFCARARVINKITGKTIASDYLGNCIYESFKSFMDHKECAKHQRELRKQPGKESVLVGSYFSDMVATVIKETRETINNMQSIKMRAV